jgi:uncharacterized protein
MLGMGRAGVQAEPTRRLTTPRGEATVVLDRPPGRPRSLLLLGHGAAGDVDAVDLVAVRDAAVGAGVIVARVTQPYRVAGRRSPPSAPILDEAWMAAVSATRELAGAGVPLLVGGRSSGARVACRTASALGAVGVLALAYPLHPPGKPEVSRASELNPELPTLVVNGDRDPFGVPEPVGNVVVVIRPGERHDLRRNPVAVGEIAVAWLREHRWAG